MQAELWAFHHLIQAQSNSKRVLITYPSSARSSLRAQASPAYEHPYAHMEKVVYPAFEP